MTMKLYTECVLATVCTLAWLDLNVNPVAVKVDVPAIAPLTASV